MCVVRFAWFGGENEKATRFLLSSFICLMVLWFSTAGCCCCCWQCWKTTTSTKEDWRRDCPRNRPRGVREYCSCGSRPEGHPFWKKQRVGLETKLLFLLLLVWRLFLAAYRDCLRRPPRDRLPEGPKHFAKAGEQQQLSWMLFLGKRHRTSFPRGPRRAILVVAGKHRKVGTVVVVGGEGESPLAKPAPGDEGRRPW